MNLALGLDPVPFRRTPSRGLPKHKVLMPRGVSHRWQAPTFP